MTSEGVARYSATGVPEASALSAPGEQAAPFRGPGLGGPVSKLPRLHWCAYKGDLQGILHCITDGCNIREMVSLRNQHGRLVCGITALFLAAQRGHDNVVKLLVENGASPVQPCFIQGSTELCTPAEVASLNLHFKLARYLKAAARARRFEDEVLALDEDDTASQSGRLARGLEKARKRYNATAGGSRAGSVTGLGSLAGAGGLGRLSAHSALGAAPSVGTGLGAGGMGGSTAGDAEAAQSMAGDGRAAALNFIQHVDLSSFDPTAESQPRLKSRSGNPVKSFFKKITGGMGRSENGSASMAAGGGGGGLFGGGAPSGVSPSTRVRGSSQGGSAGGAVDPKVDPKVLRFLKDLDLASWQPEHDGPLSTGVPPSPGRGRASPPRSVRSANPSPPRSHA